jgi:hypothetical protein
MTESNREKLLAKIRALFSKTVENGATEAEEMAAAEKAHELVEKYQLDLGAEELKKEGFKQNHIKMADRTQFTFARRIMWGIDDFCEVKTWTMLGGELFVIFGLTSDVEFGSYLVESLTTFALAGADLHVAAERKMAIALGAPLESHESRETRRSYLIGCANRINSRLREMARERRQRSAKPGSYGALVNIDKPVMLREEMERLGIRLRSGSGLTGASDRGAFTAGSAHGSKATFGRPIAGGRVAGQIERK